MTRRWRHHIRLWAIWVLLAPFFMLSTIADGVMPVSTPQGMQMIICTPQGASYITIDPETGEPVKGQASPGCDWAATKSTAMLARDAVTLVLVDHITAPRPPAAPTLLRMAQATGLPPSTGPPFPA